MGRYWRERIGVRERRQWVHIEVRGAEVGAAMFDDGPREESWKTEVGGRLKVYNEVNATTTNEV